MEEKCHKTWERNNSLHKKGEGYKKIKQSFTYQSEYCSKSGTKHLKKMEPQPSHRDVRSSTEVNTSSGASSDEKVLKKIDMQVHCSYLKK